MIIGQKKFLNNLSKYSFFSFPHSTLILGEEGSGKHLISNYIADNILNLSLVEITDKINNTYIENIYINPIPKIYLINLDKLTERNQNIILKFLEEPLQNIFIILLSSSKINILNTILNRCIIFEMNSYSKEELETFIEDSWDSALVLDILKTPGKIKNLNYNHLISLCSLCDNIITKLNVASYSNTLSIISKINFKEEFDKYDFNLFFDTLIYSLFKRYLNQSNIKLYNLYLILKNDRKKLLDSRLNKELFLINLLSRMWRFYNDK